MMQSKFHIATEEEIFAGKVTDVYFERSRQILQAENADKRVVAEFVVKNFPKDLQWGVFAGLEEAAEILKTLPVKAWTLPEGTLFRADEPVLVIEGNYLDFGSFETSLLGLICQASGIATQAARCRVAAEHRPVISFGARRMHPAIAPMIERNAFIGGCDGVATIKSAELLGIEPTGTMPHALVLMLGDTLDSMQAFDRHIDPKVARVCLIDTFADEKFEAIRIAEALGDKLFAIRLDTPGSRRGDLVKIMKEIRWELDIRGHENVKLFVSGGLDSHTIRQYNEVADAYGVGTSLSSARVLDYSMDIVEIDGAPLAKRGKASGHKNLFRCDRCLHSHITPASTASLVCSACRQAMRSMLELAWDGQQWRQERKSAQEIRESVLQQLRSIERE